MRWSYNPSTRHFRAQTDSDFFVSEWSGAQAVRFVASTGESVPMRSTYTRTAPPVRHRYLSIYLSLSAGATKGRPLEVPPRRPTTPKSGRARAGLGECTSQCMASSGPATSRLDKLFTLLAKGPTEASRLVRPPALPPSSPGRAHPSVAPRRRPRAVSLARSNGSTLSSYTRCCNGSCATSLACAAPTAHPLAPCARPPTSQPTSCAGTGRVGDAPRGGARHGGNRRGGAGLGARAPH